MMLTGTLRALLFALLAVAAASTLAAANGGDLIWYFQGVEDVYGIDDIGDVDHDGVPDVIVESYDAGAVGDHLYCLSGASAIVADVIWSVKPAGGASSGGGYGDECLIVGPDFNGDGHQDILLGTAWGGRSAYVLDGMDGGVHYHFDTYYDRPPDPAASGWVYSVKPAPDLNGDGVPDIFFCCGSENDGAYCASVGDSSILWYRDLGDGVLSCAVLDDVNGDGLADALFGVGDNADAVWLLRGGGGPIPIAQWWRPMPGSVLATAAIDDISGDGVNDALAGSWSSTGEVFAFDGATGDTLWTAPIGSYAYVMQFAVLDDVNGDGYQDVAVGSFDNKAVVLSGFDGKEIWTSYAGTLNGGDIWTVGRVEDVTGDGVNDVAAGSFDYHVYLFDGVTGDTAWVYNTGKRLYFVDGVCDISGNDVPEVVAGTQMLSGPPGGRAFLIEGGEISTGVASPSLATGASASAEGIRVSLAGAGFFSACHVERIEADREHSKEAEAFKRDLIDSFRKGTLTSREVATARRLTPGPRWIRLTGEPIAVENGEAEYIDRTARPGGLYSYRFALVLEGGETVYSPAAIAAAPGEQRGAVRDPVLTVRPNPMNPATTIRFTLPASGPVRLDAFAANGRRVARILHTPSANGDVRIDWDGRDDGGRDLPSGIYFLRLEGTGFTATSRLVIIR